MALLSLGAVFLLPHQHSPLQQNSRLRSFALEEGTLHLEAHGANQEPSPSRSLIQTVTGWVYPSAQRIRWEQVVGYRSQPTSTLGRNFTDHETG